MARHINFRFLVRFTLSLGILAAINARYACRLSVEQGALA